MTKRERTAARGLELQDNGVPGGLWDCLLSLWMISLINQSLESPCWSLTTLKKPFRYKLFKVNAFAYQKLPLSIGVPQQLTGSKRPTILSVSNSQSEGSCHLNCVLLFFQDTWLTVNVIRSIFPKRAHWRTARGVLVGLGEKGMKHSLQGITVKARVLVPFSVPLCISLSDLPCVCVSVSLLHVFLSLCFCVSLSLLFPFCMISSCLKWSYFCSSWCLFL